MGFVKTPLKCDTVITVHDMIYMTRIELVNAVVKTEKRMQWQRAR